MIDEENGSGRSLLLISLRSHPGCGSADEAAGDTCGFSGDDGFRAIRILGVFAIFEGIFPNFSDISVKISLISEKSLVSPTFWAEQRCYGGFYFTALKRFRNILQFFSKTPNSALASVEVAIRLDFKNTQSSFGNPPRHSTRPPSAQTSLPNLPKGLPKE